MEKLLIYAVALLSLVFGLWVIGLIRRFLRRRNFLATLIESGAWAAYAIGAALLLHALLGPHAGLLFFVIVIGAYLVSQLVSRMTIVFHNGTDDALLVSFSDDYAGRPFELPVGKDRPIWSISFRDSDWLTFSDRQGQQFCAREIPYRWLFPQCRAVSIVPSDLTTADPSAAGAP